MNQKLKSDVKITISDINGRICKQEYYSFNNERDPSIMLDLHDLPKGMYVINLENRHLTGTKKLIIN